MFRGSARVSRCFDLIRDAMRQDAYSRVWKSMNCWDMRPLGRVWHPCPWHRPPHGRLVTKGWAEPYEMLTGLEAIRLTDEGMRAYARLV